MKVLHNAEVSTPFGKKTISVIAGNVLELDERVDVLTTSAFVGDYIPTYGSLFGALDRVGISVHRLARDPFIDLRDTCGVWLSHEIMGSDTRICRIGCVEMMSYSVTPALDDPLMTIKAYFRMLELASVAGVPVTTVALPLLGGGDQSISASMTAIPIANECISFLRRNEACERILFVELREERAQAFADTLAGMYSLLAGDGEKKGSYTAFISYSSQDRNIADNLCNKLESRGIKVWYAPRNVHGSYAAAIMKGISEATHFIVILSKNSLSSQHVLNEIDNAHARLPDLRFKPLRLDDIELTPEFSYYLSRQHWMDAFLPPIEEKLDSFVDAIISEL